MGRLIISGSDRDGKLSFSMLVTELPSHSCLSLLDIELRNQGIVWYYLVGIENA